MLTIEDDDEAKATAQEEVWTVEDDDAWIEKPRKVVTLKPRPKQNPQTRATASSSSAGAQEKGDVHSGDDKWARELVAHFEKKV